jgi:hypothetical protein
VGRRTPLQNEANMRTIVLIDRIVKMLTLFLVIIPKPALCDMNIC